MSELPPGWVETTFGRVFDFKGGSQPPKSEFSDKPLPGYVRLLQIRDFESDEKAVFIRDALKWPKCSTSDIMLGRYGASVGRVLTGKAGAYNVALVKMQFDRQCLEPDWVRSFLNTDYFQEPLRQISRSAQNGFNKSDLEEISVPLPPLPEQRRIVTKIDSLSGKSKRVRDNLNHLPRLVEKYKEAVLHAAFNGNFCESRPDEEVTLSSLIADPIRNGLSVRGTDDPPGVRALRLSALRSGTVDLTDVRYLPIDSRRAEAYLLRSGDILVSRGNGNRRLVGISAVVPEPDAPTIFPDTAFRIRLAPSIALPKWFHFLWSAPQVRRQLEPLAKTTAGIWKLSQADLNSVKIPKMSLDDQKRSVGRVQTAFAWIDRLASEATSARKLIDHLDQAILSKAFRGELVPQDRNDEPASLLLERIRTERDQSGTIRRGCVDGGNSLSTGSG